MFEAYARFLVQPRIARAVVAITLVVLTLGGLVAANVPQDDDVLAFLPASNPDIATFHRINERFGSTDVALVGLPVSDPFDPRFLERLSSLTRQLRDTEGLDSVLSLTNVADFRDDPETGGIVTDDLISAVPQDEAEKIALRERVMSRDHIVGTLINQDADAVVVYAFGLSGIQPRDLAQKVRRAVEHHMPDVKAQYGGAPFISTYIYETTQEDMRRLTPWAVTVIILIMIAAFRDLVGSALGLVATTVGIVVSRAAMALTDTPVNIVLSSMPIILFAIGSAYAIHILSHVSRHTREVGPGPEAVVRTLVGTGPTVAAAGLTTAAGLGSFVVMDIGPMQSFGWFTALGILVALLTSLSFVPAVLSLWPRPVRATISGPLKPAMQALAAGTQRHRHPVGLVVGLVALLGLGLAGQVDTRMDLRAFFERGSPPDRAQAFLDERFGGSTFIQVSVRGDLAQPAVLREIGRIADEIRTLPKVTDVQSVEMVIGLVGEAMAGVRRVPDTPAQLAVLYRFAESDPSLKRLVSPERDEALLQIKVGTADADEVDATLAAIRSLLSRQARDHRIEPVTPDRRDLLHRQVEARTRALLRAYDVPIPRDLDVRLPEALASTAPAARPEVVQARVSTFLASEESFVPLDPGPARAVAEALAQAGASWESGDLFATIEDALQPWPDRVDLAADVELAVEQPLRDAWREATARALADTLIRDLRLTLPLASAGERLRGRLTAKLLDLDTEQVLVPSAPAGPSPSADDPDTVSLTWTVSGMPVLYQGLSRSVRDNQFKSLGLALGLIFLLMSAMYRSVSTGLLATAPTGLTLAAIYGGMGWLGVRLDIGTSMLASIILGAGVDYAVHLLAAWRGDTPLEAAQHAIEETSHAIWTNALMVAAGFFVLTLGDARPLKNVGSLTTAAMLIAAFSTFLVIPLLARQTRYQRGRTP